MLARGADYMPVTFEDRGAAIGFTTPKLNQARIRQKEERSLELLVPDFADSGGTYVIPWKAVPNIVSMTLHDRELHKLISEKWCVTPRDVRRVQMDVGARGLAGPVMARACKQALGEDTRLGMAANFALIQKVFGFLGFETSELRASNFLTPQTQAHVKRAFQVLAKEISTTPAECYGAIAEQSASLAELGVPGADPPGRLRRLMAEMRSLSISLDGWSATTYSELRSKTTIVKAVLEQTLLVADFDLNRLDQRIAKISSFIKNWHRESREVQRLGLRLTWLLDGWDHIAASWEHAIACPDADPVETLNEIVRVLPRVPRKELEGIPQFAETPEKLTSNRRVQSTQDWRTRSSDFELVQRLEAIKGAAT